MSAADVQAIHDLGAGLMVLAVAGALAPLVGGLLGDWMRRRRR